MAYLVDQWTGEWRRVPDGTPGAVSNPYAQQDAGLEQALTTWQASQRTSSPWGGGGADVNLDALRGYLATDGATAGNLGAKLRALATAQDPRLSATARALLADSDAMGKLSTLYANQDNRYAIPMGEAASLQGPAQGGAPFLSFLGAPVDPSRVPTTTQQVDQDAIGAVDELDANYASALGGLEDVAKRNPYSLATDAGRSNFERLLGAQRNQQLIAGLGYQRPIQTDASGRGMLQAGTTAAKTAAAEGAMDAALVNRQAALEGDFLNRSTDYDTRVSDQILGLKTSTAPVELRMRALENIRGGLDRTNTHAEARRAAAVLAAQEAKAADSNSLGQVAEAVGSIGGSVLAGALGGPMFAPAGYAAGQALGKAAGSIFSGGSGGNQAPRQPRTPGTQMDAPKPTYGLAMAALDDDDDSRPQAGGIRPPAFKGFSLGGMGKRA